MSQAVLLADIDNTLYDWPSFFAPSFRAMIHALSRELDVSEDQLYDESKAAQQFFCNFRAGCGTGSSLFGCSGPERHWPVSRLL